MTEAPRPVGYGALQVRYQRPELSMLAATWKTRVAHQAVEGEPLPVQ
jgi:hypothetical protein